jgi:hypothetical protein
VRECTPSFLKNNFKKIGLAQVYNCRAFSDALKLKTVHQAAQTASDKYDQNRSNSFRVMGCQHKNAFSLLSQTS